MIAITITLSAKKYSGEIFKLGAGVRNLALGNIGVTDENNANLAYWNPALLTKSKGMMIELMHSEEFSGLLKYDTAGITWGIENRFSLWISRIGINDIPLTKLSDPTEELSDNNRPYEYKNVDNSDYIIYFGTTRSIFNGFPLGISAKVLYRSLAEETGYGFGIDLSTFHDFSNNYRLGIRAHDIFTTMIIWNDGENESVYPGVDFENRYAFIMPIISCNSFLYLNIETLFEKIDEAALISFGATSMDIHSGLEVNIKNLFSVYFGYDREYATTGLSLSIKNWKMNYAFEYNSELENSHRVSLGYSL